jgi:hypothetical protein
MTVDEARLSVAAASDGKHELVVEGPPHVGNDMLSDLVGALDMHVRPSTGVVVVATPHTIVVVDDDNDRDEILVVAVIDWPPLSVLHFAHNADPRGRTFDLLESDDPHTTRVRPVTDAVEPETLDVTVFLGPYGHVIEGVSIGEPCERAIHNFVLSPGQDTVVRVDNCVFRYTPTFSQLSFVKNSLWSRDGDRDDDDDDTRAVFSISHIEGDTKHLLLRTLGAAGFSSTCGLMIDSEDSLVHGPNSSVYGIVCGTRGKTPQHVVDLSIVDDTSEQVQGQVTFELDGATVDVSAGQDTMTYREVALILTKGRTTAGHLIRATRCGVSERDLVVTDLGTKKRLTFVIPADKTLTLKRALDAVPENDIDTDRAVFFLGTDQIDISTVTVDDVEAAREKLTFARVKHVTVLNDGELVPVGIVEGITTVMDILKFVKDPFDDTKHALFYADIDQTPVLTDGIMGPSGVKATGFVLRRIVAEPEPEPIAVERPRSMSERFDEAHGSVRPVENRSRYNMMNLAFLIVFAALVISATIK